MNGDLASTRSRANGESNPFATRFTRPGAVAFRFPAGPKLPQLVSRLRDTGGWGQVVGPHGSGKSTLLDELLPKLACQGFAPTLFALHDRQRRMPRRWQRSVPYVDPRAQRTLIVVDGFEQLSRWNQFCLRRICVYRHWGLLITAHRSHSLPILFRTATSTALLRELVDSLLPDDSFQITDHQLASLWSQYEGNLRDVFFALYDRYEQAKSA